MKLLAEITDKSLGLGDAEKLLEKYELRKSARAILLNEKGEMATQYLQNHFYHKLPGGGVDPGETIEEALKREIREEVGCDCEVESLVGITIEYRNEYNLLHISFCHSATVVGEIGEPTLEPGEIEEGQITKWIKPEEVLELMKKDNPEKYNGKFILKREMTFLEEFLKSTLT
ncbi:NUDIX domain-containing protein [Candidatus Kaiserbacteria bacterium]|nr:NUDIX domain-containing protein [Candidatus Kaiserbacteria bacterium]